MCTVTFIARRNGYALGMNRDEQLTRVKGLAPSRRGGMLGPTEPNGGTWIAVNERGVTLALINWYAITARVNGETISRGTVIHEANSAEAVAARLQELRLKQINPFRLIGIFPESREVVEWVWDLKRLARKDLPWRTQQWASSGLDEAKAQRVRGEIFREASKQATAGTMAWLRRLHRSHAPERGAFSTCMHRADAATVSYTEVRVSASEAKLVHHAGCPCEHAGSSHRLRLRR
jgi:hypothetical protein